MNEKIKQYPQTNGELVRLLEERQISPTSQRMSIAEILLTKPQHLSAEQVLAKAREYGANVSKATVYNTLNLFADKGLLREVVIEGGKIFFDSNATEHHHFFNEETGELVDFDLEQLMIANMPNLPENTIKTGVEVIVRIKKSNS